jgi:cob(I)alamin adenosyltransferase
MIQVYTGDGKGKTTASFGLALRATGAGKSVVFIQFGKNKPSSEGKLAIKLGLFPVHNFWSEGFLTSVSDPTLFREACLSGLSFAEEILLHNPPDLLVLDEAAVCLRMNVITQSELEHILDICPLSTELIITGRGAPRWLTNRADLVTDMHMVKHYYQINQTAREGIEF